MPVSFLKKARRQQARLRLCLSARSGRGKSISALRIALGITHVVGGRIAVIDTERDSASLYGSDDDRHHDDLLQYDFDSLNLTNHHPGAYVLAINEIEKLVDAAGNPAYSVIIVDSLTHAWESDDGGALALHAAASAKSGNSYTAWRDVTPFHNKLINAMLKSRCHIIGTMRTKVAHVVTTDDRGKAVPVKIGLKPIQREGMDYEFTITADIDEKHNLIIDKTRWSEIDGMVVNRPGPEFGEKLARWLMDARPEQADSPVMVNAMAAAPALDPESLEPTPDQARQVAALATVPDPAPAPVVPKTESAALAPAPAPVAATPAPTPVVAPTSLDPVAPVVVSTLSPEPTKPAAGVVNNPSPHVPGAGWVKPDAPAAAPAEPEPAAAFFADIPGKITPDQATRIRDHFAALEDNNVFHKDGQPPYVNGTALAAAVAKRKAARLEDLTSKEAAEIIENTGKVLDQRGIVVKSGPTLRDTLPAPVQGGPLPGSEASPTTPMGGPDVSDSVEIPSHPTKVPAEKPAPKRAARKKVEPGSPPGPESPEPVAAEPVAGSPLGPEAA